MSTPSPNLFLHVGKVLRDKYGRQVGRIVSLAVSPDGQVNEVFVELENGDLFRQSVDQLSVEGDNVTLLSPTKLKADVLCNQIPLIWRKGQALSDLFNKKTIPPDMYDELHKDFEDALDQLKADAQITMNSVDKQTVKCDQQARELNSALVHLEIEREIGKINDDAYQAAIKIIQEDLERIRAEKSDLEETKRRLSNMLLGEESATLEGTEKETSPVSSAPTLQPQVPDELPEPPIVVHVKSADKSVS